MRLGNAFSPQFSPARVTHPSNRCSYHAIVRFSPSSSVVLAVQPISLLARDTSRQRRGCPSGLLGSHTMLPSNPESLATSSVSALMLISRPEPRFIGSGESYFSTDAISPSAQSSTYRNSLLAEPVPQAGTDLSPRRRASTHLRISAGIT